jgi:hypothetical protein
MVCADYVYLQCENTEYLNSLKVIKKVGVQKNRKETNYMHMFLYQIRKTVKVRLTCSYVIKMYGKYEGEVLYIYLRQLHQIVESG